jgi:hypothetical protein
MSRGGWKRSDARFTVLHDLHADLRERLGKDAPINVLTVRQATDDEIRLWNWHHEILARERVTQKT